ncbi:methyltransferase domain-containing protein [Teredinibacter sp. KSP-S5-2]|uniref:methyltransferase domain-containing protein n=1 Tax=Teredinibacter sp. KSP-S5-2 TaxID=3034506 RepID=UPI002934F389|nr:methyltransferase domain-containing protein [Teredinibacter sp. KSP-S5-2]WNO07944.1 methyltransferase domain-containing protein [Teredinibacter sp. KSP-S5-2]
MIAEATGNTHPVLVESTRLFNSGCYVEAQKKLRVFLQKKPQNHQANILMAMIKEAVADYNSALDYCHQAQKNSPNNRNYLYLEGVIYVRQKKLDLALAHYKKFFQHYPNDLDALNTVYAIYSSRENKPAQLKTLLNIATLTQLPQEKLQQIYALLAETQHLIFDTITTNGIIALIQAEQISDGLLTRHLTAYLIEKYNLSSPQPKLNLYEIFQNNLFYLGIGCTRFSSIEVEKLLTTLREAILTICIQRQHVEAVAMPMIEGIALQNYLNEYIYPIKDSEQKIITETKKLLEIQTKNKDWHVQQSEGLLLLISMFQPLYELPIRKILLNTPISKWPKSLHKIAQKTLFNIHDELALSEQIPSITPIHDEVSMDVQQHYEEHPYPRWNQIFVIPLENIGSAILRYIPDIRDQLPAPLFNESTPILVAGAGTGRHPIIVSKRFPKAKITAIDLSRRSLAYATLKAKQLNINNVNFYHGDILEFDKREQKYHYIECNGVLHHLDNPMLGLERLLQCLHPGGVIKIALYSATARKAITSERDKISKLNIRPNSDSIRSYRQAIINAPEKHQDLLVFSDFYSLSECRDLLFHQHEICFTWELIREYCHTLDINFLGLVGNQKIIDIYNKEYPNSATNDFGKLTELEQKHPYMFRGMYEFLIQK